MKKSGPIETIRNQGVQKAGETSAFERNKKLADELFPGRFVHYMNLDYAGWDEPDFAERAVKQIEDILRLVSRHYGVSKSDILSPRRHRSVVWPRQIGMYLSKQLTTRSLPEIGRRFGDRDHTTVLHAIRKIDGEIANDSRLKDEIDELKRQLNIER